MLLGYYDMNYIKQSKIDNYYLKGNNLIYNLNMQLQYFNKLYMVEYIVSKKLQRLNNILSCMSYNECYLNKMYNYQYFKNRNSRYYCLNTSLMDKINSELKLSMLSSSLYISNNLKNYYNILVDIQNIQLNFYMTDNQLSNFGSYHQFINGNQRNKIGILTLRYIFGIHQYLYYKEHTNYFLNHSSIKFSNLNKYQNYILYNVDQYYYNFYKYQFQYLSSILYHKNGKMWSYYKKGIPMDNYYKHPQRIYNTQPHRNGINLMNYRSNKEKYSLNNFRLMHNNLIHNQNNNQQYYKTSIQLLYTLNRYQRMEKNHQYIKYNLLMIGRFYSFMDMIYIIHYLNNIQQGNQNNNQCYYKICNSLSQNNLHKYQQKNQDNS